MKQTIVALIEEIKKTQMERSADAALPGNVFYMSDDGILCLERESGESRFPYYYDGLVVWAYSTGYIQSNMGYLKIFRTTRVNEESCIDFFAGLSQGEKFFPISITGATKQMYEPENVQRYTVFKRECAYYITTVRDMIFAVRVAVLKDKKIHFTVFASNDGTGEKIYLASYMDAQIGFDNDLKYWDRMQARGKYLGEGSFAITRDFNAFKNILVSAKKTSKVPVKGYYTASRANFAGSSGNGMFNSVSLKNGCFAKEVYGAAYIDVPVCANIEHYELNTGEEIRQDYVLSIVHTDEEAELVRKAEIDPAWIDESVAAKDQQRLARLNAMKAEFGELKDESVNYHLMNRFIRSVQQQVSFNAENKDFGGRLLGMRDIFQQIEPAVMWQPDITRARLCELFNFIFDNGRTPRSISLPVDNVLQNMRLNDFNEYVDQGLWAISCVHTYLSYTDDYSVLDEICGYYHLDEVDEKRTFFATEEKTTILEHLIRMTKYLISNMDTQYGTNCLRILNGDWNDAINWLGNTDEPGKKWGSGVSVMAAVHFYLNLKEMMDILQHVGGYEELCEEFKTAREKTRQGLLKYAVDNDGTNRQVVHGWGDKLAYKVGCLQDVDGQRRYNLISNAFWVLCGMLQEAPTLKKDILAVYEKLDSRYGYKTFAPPFTRDMKGIGRIVNILPGTAENGCAYVHASMFANMSLFLMGESGLAWKQLKKSVSCTHENINLSPFNMSNQYCDNPEYCLDGQALSDWPTGSAAILLKGLVKYGFGICPNLDEVVVQTPAVMPSDNAKLQLSICGKRISLDYCNRGVGRRTYAINGKEVQGEYDSVMNTYKVKIRKADLADGMTITVCD